MKRRTRVNLLAACFVPVVGASHSDALAQADPPDVNDLPVLLCDLETSVACKPGGSECESLKDLDGEPLPIKITVDAPSSVATYPGKDGFPSTSTIGTAARLGNQLILQGMDGIASWQMLVHEPPEAKADLVMSLSVAVAEAVTVGFGRCRIRE
ncbi:hypothetical protein [Mesorhizobium sp. L-8-3]|uniref:hypothetical protein n=1 Tax=Mesorhizobium sp. L-8-3 TaxID=2744522 RepID=UPI001927F346|nr:hypothetical protein [Mesorhizobium sp. L-8-3]BCH24562.1 hypothetical protein MesoLjLb_43470 [Mesorhizobium sp. L-8-3]